MTEQREPFVQDPELREPEHPIYNLPLLRKERDWVAEQRALPYEESQLLMDCWHVDDPTMLDVLYDKTCGTTYCVAGHIAATTPGVGWRGGSGLVVNGEPVDVQAWARDELGLSHKEASDLFYSNDDEVLEELDLIIARAEAAERA